MLEPLPKALARNPYVRALGMRVYPHSPKSVIVVGGSVPHEVFAFNNQLKCDCTAAQYGRFCAHVAAIEHLRTQSAGKEIAAMFTVDRSSAERRKVVPLPTKRKIGYAGLFSGWFLHKGEFGTSIGVKILVTHAAAAKGYDKLEQLTEAMTFVNDGWWINNKKGTRSHLVSLVAALTGATNAQLEKMTNEEIETSLNDGVGSGILFAASIEEKKGEERNTLDKDSFEPCDEAFSKLAAAMSQKLEIKATKDGQNYIAKPQPAFQTEEQQQSGGGEDLDAEVPF